MNSIHKGQAGADKKGPEKRRARRFPVTDEPEAWEDGDDDYMEDDDDVEPANNGDGDDDSDSDSGMRKETGEERKREIDEARAQYAAEVMRLQRVLASGSIAKARNILDGEMLGGDTNVLADIVRDLATKILAIRIKNKRNRLSEKIRRIIDTGEQLGLDTETVVETVRSIVVTVDKEARSVLEEVFDFVHLPEKTEDGPKTFKLIGLEFRDDMEQDEALTLLRSLSGQRFAHIASCAVNKEFIDGTRKFIFRNFEPRESLYQFALRMARAALPVQDFILEDETDREQLWALYVFYIFENDIKQQNACRKIIDAFHEQVRKARADATPAGQRTGGGENGPSRAVVLQIEKIVFCSGFSKSHAMGRLRSLNRVSPEDIRRLSHDSNFIQTAKLLMLDDKGDQVPFEACAMRAANHAIATARVIPRWAVNVWLLFGDESQKAQALIYAKTPNLRGSGGEEPQPPIHIGDFVFREGMSSDVAMTQLRGFGKLEPSAVVSLHADNPTLGALAENLLIGVGSDKDYFRRFALTAARHILKAPPAVSRRGDRFDGYPRWAVYVLILLGNGDDQKHPIVVKLLQSLI